jgi:hypothetical protein
MDNGRNNPAQIGSTHLEPGGAGTSDIAGRDLAVFWLLQQIVMTAMERLQRWCVRC